MGAQLETFDLTQDALLWAVTGTADLRGEPKVTAKIPIKTGRWESSKSKSSNPESNTQSGSLTISVDRVIPIGSILWKGKLEDFNSTTQDKLFQVTAYNEVPDIENRNIRRTVTITKYGKELPTQV